MAGPVTGSLGTWKQPSRWGRNETGNYQLYSFEGTRNEIRALAAAYALVPGLAYEVVEQFGKFRLDVHFPWNEDGLVNPATDYIENWELFAHKHEKDLLDTETNSGLTATISDKQRTKIRNKIQNPPAGTTEDPDADTDFFTTGDGNAANAFSIYKLMQAGVRSYIMPAPTLRRSMVTSSRYAIGYALTNVKKILTTSYLAINENLPSQLFFNIVAYTAGDSAANAALAYGWYKDFPTIQQVARLKWQIVQEWQYGWWAKGLYGTPL